MKYRKIPVVVEAIQWTGDNYKQLRDFTGQELPRLVSKGLLLYTLEGYVEASLTDYIIKGVDNEFYPCKEDVFLKTYEKAE